MRKNFFIRILLVILISKQKQNKKLIEIKEDGLFFNNSKSKNSVKQCYMEDFLRTFPYFYVK